MANDNTDKAAIEASLTLPLGIPNYTQEEWDKLTKKQKIEVYRRFENDKRNKKVQALRNAQTQNWINDLRTWYAKNTYGTNWTNAVWDVGELNTSALVGQSPQLELPPQIAAQKKINAKNLVTAKVVDGKLVDASGMEVNKDGSVKPFVLLDQDPRKHPWRKVNGYDPNLTDQALSEIGIPRGQFAGNLAEKREGIIFSHYQIYGMPGGKGQARYNGSGLVNENNIISRRNYELNVIDNGIPLDARIELNAMLPEERLMVLNELNRVGGFYNPNVKVSNQAKSLTGWMEDDAKAMATFLDYANEHYQTWQALLPSLGSMTTFVGKGKSSFNVTSTNDIVAIVDEVFLADTGRKPTKMQWMEMAKRIQASQRTENAQNMNPSSVAVIADKMVRGSNPGESASYGLGNAMALAFKALGQ